MTKLDFEAKYAKYPTGQKSLIPIIDEEDDDDPNCGFRGKMTEQQEKVMQTQKEVAQKLKYPPVKHDKAYLRKLRDSKSAERPRPTVEKLTKNPNHYFYTTLEESEDEKETESYKQFFDPSMTLRQSTDSSVTLPELIFFKPFSTFMRQLYIESSCEMHDLREVVIALQKGQVNITFYVTILMNTKGLIDFFLDLQDNHLKALVNFKEIID